MQYHSSRNDYAVVPQKIRSLQLTGVEQSRLGHMSDHKS